MNKYNTDSNNITIDFSLFPFCFRSVSVDYFTNKLKDMDEFFNFFKMIFEKDLIFFSQYTYDNITQNTNKHSHSIQTNSKQYPLFLKIIKKLYLSFYVNSSDKDFELFLENNINEYQIWQLGYGGGVRKSNLFYVLFIDYHHLIYPDKNYNQPNSEKYDFCPITNNKIGGNVNE